MVYVTNGVRSASVRTLETVQLLRASYEDLTDCFESNANVAVSLNGYSMDPPVRTIEILRSCRCTIPT